MKKRFKSANRVRAHVTERLQYSHESIVDFIFTEMKICMGGHTYEVRHNNP